MIQQLSGVFWGHYNRHLWREGGRKERKEERKNHFLISTLIHTDYIPCGASPDGLVIRFSLAMFQIIVSTEQTSELHRTGDGQNLPCHHSQCKRGA